MPDRGIAIVGMAARFPGAADLEALARNIEVGVDATREAPPDRWDPVFYDATSGAADRLYCRRGGFLASPFAFDALAFGIMPVAAEGAEPDQLLALDAAARALADAGHEGRRDLRERTGVILGRGGYLTAGIARLEQRVRAAEQLAQNLRALVPGVDLAALAAVKAEFQAQLAPFAADTAIGLVPNLAASRIANRLDLRGAAYTVDAACASSLLAVDQACRELTSGRADRMIAGGVHVCHDPTFWSVFCQLGALSRSGRLRPFSRSADGLVVGEGVGMVVLRRLEDAEHDGDRIYAVLRGAGVSSDGRAASLQSPAVEGQVLALARAWEAADLDPTTVGLVEAHGTGTVAGDTAELATLARFFGPTRPGEPRAALGSIKGMIGHAMPAAGIAGLIKAALAIHRRTLPIAVPFDEPRPELLATRFELLASSRPWTSDGVPRRAGVSAFGFGGINAHVVLEEAPRPRRAAALPDAPGQRETRRQARSGETEDKVVRGMGGPNAFRSSGGEGANPLPGTRPPPPLILEASSRDELLAALAGDQRGAGSGPVRLALFDPTPARRRRASAIVERGEAWRGRDDLWFSPRGLAEDGGKVAFLFPGVDAGFAPRLDGIAERLGLTARDAHGSDHALGALGHRIIACNRLLHEALLALGLAPDVIAGHSIGEWSGMIASEMIPPAEVDPLIARLASEGIEVPGVLFLAAGCGEGRAREELADLPDLALSHDNCPHQIILCGREESIHAAQERLTKAGVLCQELPFRSGYHSPLFADFVGPHRRVLSTLPLGAPVVPLWSATTVAPYPADDDAIRHLAVRHLVEPVRFRELTEALYRDGARMFVQVGVGSLPGFASDTLRGKPHLVVAANLPSRSGIEQLTRVAAALFVDGARGAEGALFRLGARRSEAKDGDDEGDGARGLRSGGPTVAIHLGVPLVRLKTPLPLPEPASMPDALDTDAAPEGIALELAASFAELARAQREIASAFSGALTSIDEARDETGDERDERDEEAYDTGYEARPHEPLGPRSAEEHLSLSVDEHPTLLDHAFYRQPEGIASLTDRYPVVPMTMLLARMVRAAEALVPELIAVGLEDVRALRWLAVEPPVIVPIVATFDGATRALVTIEGYASGTVVLAPSFPEAPPPDETPLTNEAPARITAEELYDDRYMFHGPAYQGVVAIDSLGDDGIRGALVSLEAEGGLLDNAGQLLGYWVMEHATHDRLAMPVRLEHVAIYSPEPASGERVTCTARVRRFGPRDVRADVELVHEGRLFARIDGWEDLRFDSDPRVWEVLRYPEKNTIAIRRDEGYVIIKPPWRAAASRDLLGRRYLSERERAAVAAFGPRGQDPRILARIALKDAARDALWDRGHGPIFPIQIEVYEDEGGALHLAYARADAPRDEARTGERDDAPDEVPELRGAVAHAGGITVAIVGLGRAVGIGLAPADGSAGEREARGRAARAAAGKALGTRDEDLEITATEGDRLWVARKGGGPGTWVRTRLDEGHIVGWTEA
jgi:acyl transferase domain-containing protein